VSPLFEREGEDDLTVIEYCRTNLEARLLKQKAFIALLRFALKTLEPVQPENCADVRRPAISISVTRNVKLPS